MSEIIDIEVVCAFPSQQIVINMAVLKGTSVKTAIEESKILNHFPKLRYDKLFVGVFGEKVNDDYIVKAHDRVEIYRPLGNAN